MARITLRKTAEETVAAIFKTYTDKDDWRRPHLGASLIGHKCDRYLWLSFRWAKNPNFDGQKLRLFDRGNLEEHRVLRDLRRAGFKVQARDVNGKQFRFQDGHVGGSCDGFVEGLPESGQPHLLEIKTANSKRFKRFVEKGVKSTSREYFVQAQLYMLHFYVKRTLFVIVEKDTDNLYCERIDFDRVEAESQLNRAKAIVDMSTPPPKLGSEVPPCVYVSKDGTRWPCDYYDLCHGQATPERNCRTCVHSTPRTDDGGEPWWGCDKFEKKLGKRKQKNGCRHQRTIPMIVNSDSVQIGEGGEIHHLFRDGTEYVEGDL